MHHFTNSKIKRNIKKLKNSPNLFNILYNKQIRKILKNWFLI